MTPEEANANRLQFADEVMSQAAKDFRRKGLVLDTFKIQSISDDQRYLEAIGRRRSAEVQRDARIAEPSRKPKRARLRQLPSRKETWPSRKRS